MRKIIIMALMAATALPATSAMAQTQELRRDRQDIRQQERQLDRARATGDRGDVRKQARDVRDARQEYREDLRDHRQDVRQDRRDDWRSYRQANRAVYARGNWRAPFRYNAWNVGATLRPTYFAPRYYLNDYNRYRLPAPGRDLRYIRHYDDVLLINVRTGRVIQVYRSFFW